MKDLKEVLIETTPDLLPHKYYLNKAGKLIAFCKAGEAQIKVFDKPLSFSKSHRTFQKVKV